MRVLITGASGLIGSALAPSLTSEGHQVFKLKRASSQTDPLQPWWDPENGRIALDKARPFDAVIHLAGESIAQRWTAAAKTRIRNSRVNGTTLLTQALAQLPQRPQALIAASATGYYGNRGDELLDEQSAPGAGFLAELCRDWEAATRPAANSGIRVVNLRLGVVLSAKGGALRKMLPAFRLGLGGKLGNGRQYWSWIAIDDLLSIIRYVLSNERFSGPINAVSPHPVTNAEFTRALGSALRRPAFFNAPAFAVKLLFGEMGETALLASFRVRPARLEQSGFVFRFSRLEDALEHFIC